MLNDVMRSLQNGNKNGKPFIQLIIPPWYKKKKKS